MRVLLLAAAVLASGAPSAQAQTCGDFLREPPEQCDDGNARNLDGCDAGCRLELIHRVDELKLQAVPDGTCAANAFGTAFTPDGLSLAQSHLDASVRQGSTGVVFQFLGLDDLGGAADPALELGVLQGLPIDRGPSYDGTSDPDGGYALDKALLDARRRPVHRLPATLSGGALVAGPGPATLRLLLGSVPASLSMSSVVIGMTTGASTAPAASTGGSAGHRAYEHLDPALASFATTGAAGSPGGTVCGHVGARSLAQTPVPLVLRHGCTEGYTEAHSLLDVLVAGCTSLLAPLFPVQPDQQDPAAPPAGAGPPYVLLADPGTNAVTACIDSGGAGVDLPTCLADAAYSIYFKFTTERVIGFDDRILADSFESGDFSAWSRATPNDVSVSASAAMAGTDLGMLGLVDDTDPLFVQDDSPEDENRYRARFYVDATGFDPGEANGKRRTRLFVAVEDGPRRLSAIVLRRMGGAYALMGRARQDDGSQADTAWVPIAPGPRRVELDWQRASGPEASDGRFRLWVDGTLAADLTGLDNSLGSVDFVRLGALSVKPGASGPLRWDHFQSQRMSTATAE